VVDAEELQVKPITKKQRQSYERYRIYEGAQPRSQYVGEGGRFYRWFDWLFQLIARVR
jgi:hypothetical protein